MPSSSPDCKSARRTRQDASLSLSPESRKKKAKLDKVYQKLLISQAGDDYTSAKAKNGGRVAYGFGAKLVSQYQRIADASIGYSDFVTLKAIQNSVWAQSSKASAKVQTTASNNNTNSNDTKHFSSSVASNLSTALNTDINNNKSNTNDEQICQVQSTRKKGGRPKGTTKVANSNNNEIPQAQSTRNKGGRPKGSTIAASKAAKDTIQKALATAARELIHQRRAANTQGKRQVPKGALREIIANVEKQFDLKPGDLNAETIRSRADRNNPEATAESKTSPMKHIEPAIVEECIRLSKIGQPLTKDNVIRLAISMIKGTETEAKVIEWRTKHSFSNHDKKELLGIGWFHGFMSRHGDRLKQARARPGDINHVSYNT